MALYLGQLLPQNSQKPNYETHHPPYGTFRQQEATRMTLPESLLNVIRINSESNHTIIRIKNKKSELSNDF